jgi:hypothetical protein
MTLRTGSRRRRVMRLLYYLYEHRQGPDVRKNDGGNLVEKVSYWLA